MEPVAAEPAPRASTPPCTAPPPPSSASSPTPVASASGGGPQPSSTPGPDTGWLLASDQVTLLISAKHAQISLDQANPKLEGSKSWARYEAYKLAGTIGDFVNCGGTRADLANDFSRGWLRVPELPQILSLNTPTEGTNSGGATSEATLATIERLRKRIALSQTRGSPPPPASVFYELGLCLEKTGNLCEAMKSFKSAILAPSARPSSSVHRRGAATGPAGAKMGGTMALLEAAEAVDKHVENVEAVKAVEQAIVEEKAEEAESARKDGSTPISSPGAGPDARGVKRASPYSAQAHAHEQMPHAPYPGMDRGEDAYAYGGRDGPPYPYGDHGGYGGPEGGYGPDSADRRARRPSADADMADDMYVRPSTNNEIRGEGAYGYGAHPPPYGPGYDPRGGYGYDPRSQPYAPPYDARSSGYDPRSHPYAADHGHGYGYAPQDDERYRYTDHPGGLETRERPPYGYGAPGGHDSYDDSGSHDGMRTSANGEFVNSAGGGKRRRGMKRTVSRQNSRGGRWTPEEHELFLKGKAIHGRSWTKVAEVVGTRTTVQVRSHAQKYEIKVQREREDDSFSGEGEGSMEGDGRSGDDEANSSGAES